jgi:hypothetical protein
MSAHHTIILTLIGEAAAMSVLMDQQAISITLGSTDLPGAACLITIV